MLRVWAGLRGGRGTRQDAGRHRPASASGEGRRSPTQSQRLGSGDGSDGSVEHGADRRQLRTARLRVARLAVTLGCFVDPRSTRKRRRCMRSDEGRAFELVLRILAGHETWAACSSSRRATSSRQVSAVRGRVDAWSARPLAMHPACVGKSWHRPRLDAASRVQADGSAGGWPKWANQSDRWPLYGSMTRDVCFRTYIGHVPNGTRRPSLRMPNHRESICKH